VCPITGLDFPAKIDVLTCRESNHGRSLVAILTELSHYLFLNPYIRKIRSLDGNRTQRSIFGRSDISVALVSNVLLSGFEP
jgi:hypothetical protein